MALRLARLTGGLFSFVSVANWGPCRRIFRKDFRIFGRITSEKVETNDYAIVRVFVNKET